MIRVGFLISGTNESWLGGLNYFRNLLSAIRTNAHSNLEPIIFAGFRDDLNIFKDFPQVSIFQTSLLDRFSPAWIMRKVLQKIFSKDLLLERFLLKFKVQVLSHSAGLGINAKIPSIGWIPDFQHYHLPSFFSKEECLRRDKMFEHLAVACERVILSSYNSKNDFVRIYPSQAAKAEVLQFTVLPPRSTVLLSLPELEKKYSFKGPYFMLPNQFWEHKNHRVVIDALNILKAQGESALVLCTGNTRDLRQPEYFDKLMRDVERLGLGDRFRVLGIIPYADLVALIHHSVALINPSFFEGWSTTVEEAKSIGKKILLSGIEVHREQNPDQAVYFDPKNASELSREILNAFRTQDANTEASLRKKAESELTQRMQVFAQNYEGLVLRLVR